LNFLENSSKFAAEVDQALVDLSDLVESNSLVSVISDGHYEAKSVAFV
jgi:hypothetical protein